MKTKFLILLLVLVGVTSFNFALAKPQDHFAPFYGSNQISARHCGQNISRFVQYLASKNENISQIKVISFTAPFHSWSFGRIVSTNSRWGKQYGQVYHQNWDFHVIAVIDGMVYDFSFERTPKILPLKQYMSEMYIPKNSFDINGSTFRVRGEGPTYTASHATKELKDYQFKIMSADRHGNFTEIASRLNLEQFYQSVK